MAFINKRRRTIRDQSKGSACSSSVGTSQHLQYRSDQALSHMTSPPTSLPSPAPSASSSQHPQSFSSLAMPPHASIQRAHSTASGISVASGRESKASGYRSNGSGQQEEAGYHGYVDGSHDTPQPHHNGVQYSLANQNPFLPPVTSSPPPRILPYVPPPQHAMAPDPIHTMMGQQAVTSPGVIASPGGGWPNGPAGWRGVPPQGYSGTGQNFSRQMPNGHMPGTGPSNQLPNNPHEPYHGRMSMPPLAMNGRPGSRQGESRDRRSQRDEKEADDEVITTIFVVGFPDDMLVRADLTTSGEYANIDRSENSKISSPLRPVSKQRH